MTDSFYIGNKALRGNEWTFFSPDPYAVGIKTLALLENTCIPLRDTFFGEIDSGKNFDQILGYPSMLFHN